MIQFDAGAFSDCGLYRQTNEDSFLLCDYLMADDKRSGACGYRLSGQSFGVAAVFDGMGGEAYGDLASGIAAGLLAERVDDILNRGRSGLNAFVAEANAAILVKSGELRASMGSTLVLIAVSNDRADVYNIGDSRAYVVREGRIIQITKDHTVAAALEAIGAEAGNQKHILTQYLGMPADEMVLQAFSYGNFKLRDKDRILLCSDGVTGGLNMEQLLAVLSQEKTAAELSVELVDAAARNGSRDNMTAIVFIFSDDGRPSGQRIPAKIAEPRANEPLDKTGPLMSKPEPLMGKTGLSADKPAMQPSIPSGRRSVSREKTMKSRTALFWFAIALMVFLLGFILWNIHRLINAAVG